MPSMLCNIHGYCWIYKDFALFYFSHSSTRTVRKSATFVVFTCATYKILRNDLGMKTLNWFQIWESFKLLTESAEILCEQIASRPKLSSLGENTCTSGNMRCGSTNSHKMTLKPMTPKRSISRSRVQSAWTSSNPTRSHDACGSRGAGTQVEHRTHWLKLPGDFLTAAQ